MSTITKEFTKERLEEIAEDGFLKHGESKELARMALAGMEAEPVAFVKSGYALCYYRPPSEYGLKIGDKLYAAPQPATVVDADDNFYSWFGREWADHYQPNQYTTAAKQMLGVMAESAWKAGRRAAMLQGADQPQNVQQNIPENIPATQFKPVADLYGLTSPTGGETSFTFDAVEARDFIDGGWSCQEYVELERYQEAVSGNSPVIPEELLSAMEEVLRISDRDHDAWRRAKSAIAKCRKVTSPDSREKSDSSTDTRCSACGRCRDAGDVVHLPSYRLCSDCIATASDVVAERRGLHVMEVFDKRKREVREEMELGARVTKNRFKL